MKFLLVPALLLAIGLGGCATGTIGAPPITPANVSDAIAQVQTVTKQVCSFVPTAQTVAHILSAIGVPGVSVVSDIAGQICTAVTTAPLADGGSRQAKVNGVVIRGKFVR